jgi:hypothetical protein
VTPVDIQVGTAEHIMERKQYPEHENYKEPSLVPYLVVAAVAVLALLGGMVNVVERAAVPLEAHVARSMGVAPASEAAFAKDEAPREPSREPFRPRG